MSTRNPCRAVAFFLILALFLPSPALALRPAGLEESSDANKKELVASLTTPSLPLLFGSGLEEVSLQKVVDLDAVSVVPQGGVSPSATGVPIVVSVCGGVASRFRKSVQEAKAAGRLAQDAPENKLLYPVGAKKIPAGAIPAWKAQEIGLDVLTVIGPPERQGDLVQQTFNQHAARPIVYAVQEKPLGTGHAVYQALAGFKDPSSLDRPVVVMMGDQTLLGYAIQGMLEFAAREKADVLVSASRFADPKGKGRVVARRGTNEVVAIVEQAVIDAMQPGEHLHGYTKEELDANPLGNVSLYYFRTARLLRDLLGPVTPTPPKNEYYVTDVVQNGVQRGGLRMVLHEVDPRLQADLTTLANIPEVERFLQELEGEAGLEEKRMSLKDMEELLKIKFSDEIHKEYPEGRYEAAFETSPGAVNSPRALGTLTIFSKEDGRRKSFIVKTPNSVTEPAAAQYASDEQMGPSVLYASKDLLIEEMFPAGYELASRGLLLSPDESALFGRELADSFHKMRSQGKFLYSSKGFQTHLILLELEEGGMAVRFLDWSDAAAVSTPGSPFAELRLLEHLAFAVKTYIRKPRENVVAWKNFAVRLGELEGEDRVYTDPERGLLFKLRRRLTSENPDPDARRSWEEFYKAGDERHALGNSRIVVTGKALLKKIWGDRQSDVVEESAQVTIQGRRSLRLKILHEESSLIDSEIAQAITADLFERGYLGEAINSSWGRTVGILGVYLKSRGIESEAIESVQGDLAAARPFSQVVSAPSEVRELVNRALSRHRVKDALRLSEACVSFVLSNEAQSISIRTAILGGMRNRDFGETLEVYLEGKPAIKIKEYVIKGPHKPDEPSRSVLASKLNLGPHVVFARSWGDGRPGVIVEDLLPAEKNISLIDPAEFAAAQARNLLAENLALKFYTMMDPKRKTVMHAFDNRTQHIFVLGEESGYDVLMIDWAFPNALGESRYHSRPWEPRPLGRGGSVVLKPERSPGLQAGENHFGPHRVVEQIADMLEGLHEDFEKFGPLFWSEFKSDMIGLARSNGALEAEIASGFDLMMDHLIQRWSGRPLLRAAAPTVYFGDLSKLLEYELSASQVDYLTGILLGASKDSAGASVAQEREVSLGLLSRILSDPRHPNYERAKAYLHDREINPEERVKLGLAAGLEERPAMGSEGRIREILSGLRWAERGGGMVLVGPEALAGSEGVPALAPLLLALKGSRPAEEWKQVREEVIAYTEDAGLSKQLEGDEGNGYRTARWISDLNEMLTPAPSTLTFYMAGEDWLKRGQIPAVTDTVELNSENFLTQLARLLELLGYIPPAPEELQPLADALRESA